jgi:hypothetical protein
MGILDMNLKPDTDNKNLLTVKSQFREFVISIFNRFLTGLFIQ